MTSMIKTCRICETNKPVEDFSKKGNYVYSYCKTCRNERTRMAYAGQKPEPLVRTYTRLIEKSCKICAITKPVAAFIPNTRSCKACFSLEQKAKKALDPNVKYPTKPRLDETLGIEVKQCSKCRVEKPISAFGVGKKRIRSQCKECDRETLNASRAAMSAEHKKAQNHGYNIRRRSSQKIYRLKNKERDRLYAARWRKDNPDIVKETFRRHSARRRGAPVVERIHKKAIIARDNSTCYLCSRVLTPNEITLDHVVPVSRGGNHTNDNLRVACRPCNSGKRDLLLEEYLAKRIILPADSDQGAG